MEISYAKDRAFSDDDGDRRRDVTRRGPGHVDDLHHDSGVRVGMRAYEKVIADLNSRLTAR